jgi:hypothetical protein
MILATGDADRAKKMLGALLGHSLGAEALLFTALGRKDYYEFLAAPANHAITRGTWQELLHATYEHQPAGYAEVFGLAAAIHQEEEDGSLEFAAAFIHAMHEQASKYHTAVEAAEEDFVDI